MVNFVWGDNTNLCGQATHFTIPIKLEGDPLMLRIAF